MPGFDVIVRRDIVTARKYRVFRYNQNLHDRGAERRDENPFLLYSDHSQP